MMTDMMETQNTLFLCLLHFLGDGNAIVTRSIHNVIIQPSTILYYVRTGKKIRNSKSRLRSRFANTVETSVVRVLFKSGS